MRTTNFPFSFIFHFKEDNWLWKFCFSSAYTYYTWKNSFAQIKRTPSLLVSLVWWAGGHKETTSGFQISICHENKFNLFYSVVCAFRQIADFYRENGSLYWEISKYEILGKWIMSLILTFNLFLLCLSGVGLFAVFFNVLIPL